MSEGSDQGRRIDPLDPDVSPEELAAEAARDAGVAVHVRPRFEPGSKQEARAERRVALAFTVTLLAALAFAGIYIFWPWEWGDDLAWLYTPLLGLTMGIALAGLGFGAVLWAKKVMPEEEAVQERHGGSSPAEERALTKAFWDQQYNGAIRRRRVLGGLGLGGLGVAILAIMPLGGLIKRPGDALFTTLWGPGVRLVRSDGTPVSPADLRPGAIETVFPGVPGGLRPAAADSPTMLIRVRSSEEVIIPEGREDWHYEDYFAYSKICTHAGCPVSLYEQQTNRLLCPCHQSQFLLTDACRPVFGPASQPLPQLPIALDDEGFFIATSDYREAVGPAFWDSGKEIA